MQHRVCAAPRCWETAAPSRTLQKAQFCCAPDHGPPDLPKSCFTGCQFRCVRLLFPAIGFLHLAQPRLLRWPGGGTASWETEAKQDFLFRRVGFHCCWFLMLFHLVVSELIFVSDFLFFGFVVVNMISMLFFLPWIWCLDIFCPLGSSYFGKLNSFDNEKLHVSDFTMPSYSSLKG